MAGGCELSSRGLLKRFVVLCECGCDGFARQFTRLPTPTVASYGGLPATFANLVPTNVVTGTSAAVGWTGHQWYSNVLYYADRFAGFFVPPVSANYSFYVASDDMSELWLSPDQFAANASMVASVQTWSATPWIYWSTMSTAISSPKYLVAGKRYYIQVRHQQAGSVDFCFLGVRIFNPPGRFNSTVRDARYSAVHERQTVTISTAYRGASHTVTVSFAANISGSFMLNITGVGVTAAVPANASALTFLTAITAKAPLNGCAGSLLSVTRTNITSPSVCCMLVRDRCLDCSSRMC